MKAIRGLSVPGAELFKRQECSSSLCLAGYTCCTEYPGYCCPTGVTCILSEDDNVDCDLDCTADDTACGDGCCGAEQVCEEDECVASSNDSNSLFSFEEPCLILDGATTSKGTGSTTPTQTPTSKKSEGIKNELGMGGWGALVVAFIMMLFG